MSSQPVGVLKDCIACDVSGKLLCISCKGIGKDNDGDVCYSCNGKGHENWPCKFPRKIYSFMFCYNHQIYTRESSKI
jgi:hypothetical protein